MKGSRLYGDWIFCFGNGSRMIEGRNLKIGEIVQLNPDTTKNKMFAGCLMVITEPKAFGAQGYVQALGAKGEPGGVAYYRARWEEMDETNGLVMWLLE